MVIQNLDFNDSEEEEEESELLTDKTEESDKTEPMVIQNLDFNDSEEEEEESELLEGKTLLIEDSSLDDSFNNLPLSQGQDKIKSSCMTYFDDGDSLSESFGFSSSSDD